MSCTEVSFFSFWIKKEKVLGRSRLRCTWGREFQNGLALLEKERMGFGVCLTGWLSQGRADVFRFPRIMWGGSQTGYLKKKEAPSANEKLL